jgi:alpha/beta superfamily hydrolase
MSPNITLREIPGPSGPLEVLLDEPSRERGVDRDGLVATGTNGVRAAVVFGHPHPQYGGTMHTKVVYQSAKALARIGCAVLRFNFRGVGASTGTWDNGAGEHDDFRAALDFMHERYAGAPLWAAGMSFGSWVGLNAGAGDSRVGLLLGVAIALSRDYETVARSPKPKFFIHGERDEICSIHDVRAFYARCAEPKELVVIDAANHLFDGRVGEVGDAIEDLLGDWGGPA